MTEVAQIDAVEVLKTKIVEGISAAYKEGGAVEPEVIIQTDLGRLRFKTRPISPDSVTVVYLNDRRLYKILIDCTMSRAREVVRETVETKLSKESFTRQVQKVLAEQA